MLTPGGNYYNFSGCGNTLNCNNPIVRQLILECLRYWTVSYRIDGFRFDLASILGRHEDGSPLNNPPLLELLATDPILRNVKLIAEAWDAGGLYQVGKFPASKRWAEWNGRYRDSLRAYLKGDYWHSWEASWSISGSGDLYGGFYSDNNNNYAGYNSCVNFLTCHDGFTLYDLYSYNEKHNEGNGWSNTDGSNDNRSWNCGIEGDTDDPDVLRLRFRMIRNACAVLMCSRGTPMFLAGDEFGNTQYGNNNAYCQDNEISWLNWNQTRTNGDLLEFVKAVIAFRKAHPVFHGKREPRLMDYEACGFPDVSYHGVKAWAPEFDPFRRQLGILYCGSYGKRPDGTEDDYFFVAYNMHWEPHGFAMPHLPKGMTWHVAFDTGDREHNGYFEPGKEPEAENQKQLMAPARTILVMIGKMKASKEE